MDALNRLTKWRGIFAGWQLGTRPKSDPEAQAVRDHRELSMLLRAEVTAITGILLQKGICTIDEFKAELEKEANLLEASYQRRFPGLRAVDDGIEIYDTAKAAQTMKGWLP